MYKALTIIFLSFFTSCIQCEYLESNIEKYRLSLLEESDQITRSSVLDDQPLVVSIGGACLAAVELYRLGIRKAAYPFDVIVSELDGVINAIKSNFKFFCEPTNLTRRIFKNKYHVYNTYYNFLHPHDLMPTDHTKLKVIENLNALKEFKEKYQRRF